MSRSTGGALDLKALSVLTETAGPGANRMAHFHTLATHQQAEAICRLAATGMSAHGIAHATGLAVEQVRRVVADHGQGKATA